VGDLSEYLKLSRQKFHFLFGYGNGVWDWHFWIFVLSGYPPVYTHSLLLRFPFKNGDDGDDGDDGDEKDGLAGSDLYVIVMYG
jgi:hypothetical protein